MTVPVTDTPEFKAALAAAVQEAVSQTEQRITKQLAEAVTARGGEPAPNGDRDFVRELAMSIAELSDQGTSRKRVAPEILAAMEEARKRMVARIIKARADGEIALYRVVNKTYLAEQVVEPFRVNLETKRPEPVEIEWSGVPNESLRPMNQVAEEIFVEFVAAIRGATIIGKTKFAEDNRALGVTPGGLVVRGLPASSRRTVGNLGDPLPDPFQDVLNTPKAHDPTAKEINILGTIAAPAKQNYAAELNFPARQSGAR